MRQILNITKDSGSISDENVRFLRCMVFGENKNIKIITQPITNLLRCASNFDYHNETKN